MSKLSSAETPYTTEGLAPGLLNKEASSRHFYLPTADLVPTASQTFGEEALVADARGSLTPSQMVEHKLISLLRGNPMPVSQVQTGNLLINRGRK